MPYSRSFFKTQSTGSARSAEAIVPLVMDLVKPKSIVDVGCGVGTWLSVFRAHGVSRVLGVDGNYIDPKDLLVPARMFQPHDLKKPFHTTQRFDLVVSLEVAEHLPATSADVFVRTLTELGSTILFSAAIPHQGGTHHVNEQWPEYWAAMFRARGYEVIDCIRPLIWSDSRVDWCYAQNVLLYAQPEVIAQNPRLQAAIRNTRAEQLALVHPLKYLEQCDPEYITLRNLARWIPTLITGLPAVIRNTHQRHRMRRRGDIQQLKREWMGRSVS